MRHKLPENEKLVILPAWITPEIKLAVQEEAARRKTTQSEVAREVLTAWAKSRRRRPLAS